MRPGESFSTQMHREYALWTRFSCHPTARPKFGWRWGLLYSQSCSHGHGNLWREAQNHTRCSLYSRIRIAQESNRMTLWSWTVQLKQRNCHSILDCLTKIQPYGHSMLVFQYVIMLLLYTLYYSINICMYMMFVSLYHSASMPTAEPVQPPKRP